MARKSSTNLSAMIELVALVPWWVGVALAVVSYVWLHAVASGPLVVAAPASGHLADAMVGAVWHGWATALQYVLPIIGLAGSAVSAWRARARRRLLARAGTGTAGQAITDMTWQEFELLISEAFRHQGYAVMETGGGGADGGVDLVLRKGTEKFLVQCKHWRARQIGVAPVRELYGVVAARGASGGFLVTSGQFTENARFFVRSVPIKLIDGRVLATWIAAGTGMTEPAAGRHPPPAAASAACGGYHGDSGQRAGLSDLREIDDSAHREARCSCGH